MSEKAELKADLVGAQKVEAMAAAMARAITDIDPSPDDHVVAAAIYMVATSHPGLALVVHSMLARAQQRAAH